MTIDRRDGGVSKRIKDKQLKRKIEQAVISINIKDPS